MEFSNLTLDQVAAVLDQSVQQSAFTGHIKTAEGGLLGNIGNVTHSLKMPQWSDVPPWMQNSLIGAGIGGGVGLLGAATSKKKQYLRNLLLGSLLGGAVPGVVAGLNSLNNANTDTRPAVKPSTVPSASLPWLSGKQDDGGIKGVDDRGFMSTVSSNASDPGRLGFSAGTGAAGFAAGHMADRTIVKRQIGRLLADPKNLEAFPPAKGGNVPSGAAPQHRSALSDYQTTLFNQERAGTPLNQMRTNPLQPLSNSSFQAYRNLPGGGATTGTNTLQPSTVQHVVNHANQNAAGSRSLFQRATGTGKPVGSVKGKVWGGLAGSLIPLILGGRSEIPAE